MEIQTDIKGLYKFFEENTHLLKKHNKEHVEQVNMVKELHDVPFTYGYCFPISQFTFYFLGGYESDYNLMVAKRVPIEVKSTVFETSHWFLKHKETNQILDLTKNQFDGIIDIKPYYSKGRRANFGFPYFSKKGKRYDHCMPCKQVMKLYEEYRKTNNDNGLEWYYNEYKLINQ